MDLQVMNWCPITARLWNEDIFSCIRKKGKSIQRLCFKEISKSKVSSLDIVTINGCPFRKENRTPRLRNIVETDGISVNNIALKDIFNISYQRVAI